MASGSADTTVKIWDLNTQTCLHTMNHHKGKVQSIKWHPSEEGIMATAGFDKKVVMVDARDEKMALTKEIAADVETLIWNPQETHNLTVALEDGTVLTQDIRYFNGAPLCNFRAHEKAVSAISYSYSIKGLCVTTSPDQFIKVWDYRQIENMAPKLVSERNPGMVNAILFIYLFRVNSTAAIFIEIHLGLLLLVVQRERFTFGIWKKMRKLHKPLEESVRPVEKQWKPKV